MKFTKESYDFTLALLNGSLEMAKEHGAFEVVPMLGQSIREIEEIGFK